MKITGFREESYSKPQKLYRKKNNACKKRERKKEKKKNDEGIGESTGAAAWKMEDGQAANATVEEVKKGDTEFSASRNSNLDLCTTMLTNGDRK